MSALPKPMALREGVQDLLASEVKDYLAVARNAFKAIDLREHQQVVPNFIALEGS